MPIETDGLVLQNSTGKMFTKKLYSIIIWITVIFVIPGLLIYGFIRMFENIFDGMCGSSIHSRHVSPDGSKEMTMFSFDCGASTGGRNYRVALVRPGEQRPDKHGELVFSIIAKENDFTKPKVHWDSNQSVQISFPELAEPYRLDQEVNGITVKYQSNAVPKK